MDIGQPHAFWNMLQVKANAIVKRIHDNTGIVLRDINPDIFGLTVPDDIVHFLLYDPEQRHLLFFA
jgi:hypothetical protein